MPPAQGRLPGWLCAEEGGRVGRILAAPRAGFAVGGTGPAATSPQPRCLGMGLERGTGSAPRVPCPSPEATSEWTSWPDPFTKCPRGTSRAHGQLPGGQALAPWRGRGALGGCGLGAAPRGGRAEPGRDAGGSWGASGLDGEGKEKKPPRAWGGDWALQVPGGESREEAAGSQRAASTRAAPAVCGGA